MSIKKISGALAVVVAMLGFNSIAQADDACAADSADIKLYADMLICGYGEYDGGQWTMQSIWQFKGKKGDGCAVHEKLAKQLHTPHDEPPLGRGKGKGNNLAQGAANSLDDHKYEDALQHLQNFIDTINESARLNPDFVAAPEAHQTAAWWAQAWVDMATAMKRRVESCMPAI